MSFKYRKKPVIIEAIHFTRELFDEKDLETLKMFMPGITIDGIHHDCIVINTLEGKMRVEVGDWIVRGTQGEYYSYNPGVFESTYEKVVKGDEKRGVYISKKGVDKLLSDHRDAFVADLIRLKKRLPAVGNHIDRVIKKYKGGVSSRRSPKGATSKSKTLRTSFK